MCMPSNSAATSASFSDRTLERSRGRGLPAALLLSITGHECTPNAAEADVERGRGTPGRPAADPSGVWHGLSVMARCAAPPASTCVRPRSWRRSGWVQAQGWWPPARTRWPVGGRTRGWPAPRIPKNEQHEQTAQDDVHSQSKRIDRDGEVAHQTSSLVVFRRHVLRKSVTVGYPVVGLRWQVAPDTAVADLVSRPQPPSHQGNARLL